MPEEELLTEVAEYLDERRLIGTTVELKPCRYRGLSVVVNLQARPLADTARVEEDVAHALYTYLNPLVGGNPTGPGRGLAVRPRAQPGRALRRRPRRRRRRVRAHPAHLRDQPGDRRAVGQAGRHAHRARARRADGLGPAHRQGHAPRGLSGTSSTTATTATGGPTAHSATATTTSNGDGQRPPRRSRAPASAR